MILEKVGEVRQWRALGLEFGDGGEPAREAVEHGIVVQAHGFQPGMAAAAGGFLPHGFAFAGKSEIVLGPQQNEMVNDGRFAIHGGQLDFEVLGLAGATGQE